MTIQNQGRLLVALQFAILSGLALASAFHGLVARPGAWALGLWALGMVVGAGAVWANRPGNFNIRPVPKEGGRLIEHGPYRWIRHPMYTSVLLLAAGCAVFLDTVTGAVWWCVLLAVLSVKAVQEERLMRQVHPRYAVYRARTKRFLPFVF